MITVDHTKKERPAFLRFTLGLVLVFALGAGGCSRPVAPPPANVVVEMPEARFTDQDRETLHAYYENKELPAALTGERPVAPDLAARLEKTAKLPPGMGEMPLPSELERRLTPLAPGYQRFIVGDDVVLMDVRTREVMDVVPDVLDRTLIP